MMEQRLFSQRIRKLEDGTERLSVFHSDERDGDYDYLWRQGWDWVGRDGTFSYYERPAGQGPREPMQIPPVIEDALKATAEAYWRQFTDTFFGEREGL